MIRALAWKEWREQRSLVLSGLALAAVLPLVVFAGGAALSTVVSLRRLADVVPVVFAVLLWPLFALAAGATAFAGEDRDRTLEFLLSRPVPKNLVWTLKVLLAATATSAVIAGSFLIERGIHWIAHPPSAAEPALTIFRVSLGAAERAAFGPATLYLVFAVAVFLSGRLARAFVVAIVGLGTTFVFLAIFTLAWLFAGLTAEVREMWVAAETVIAATLLLVASRRRFMRAEAGADSHVGATTLALGVVVALTLSLGFVPPLYVDAFASLERSDVYTVAFDPNGKSLVVEANSYPSTQGSLWRLGAEGARLRLTRRLAFEPFVSPDGERVYYFSRRGFLGLARSTADLRVVNIDGSGDRLIAEEVERAPRDFTFYRRMEASQAMFSPDGTKVILRHWWSGEPMVVDLERGEVEVLREIEVPSLSRRQWRRVDPLGWLNESELLLRIYGSSLGGGTNTVVGYQALVRHDIVSGETVVVLEASRETPWSWSTPDGHLASHPVPRWLPVVTLHRGHTDAEGDTPRSYRVLRILDLETGEAEEVERFACGWPNAAMSADARIVAFVRYRSCEESDGEYLSREPELFVRNLESGEATGPLIADARIDEIRLSPSGDRIWLEVRQGDDPPSVMVSKRDGTWREVPVRKLLGGVLRGPEEVRWLDDDRLLMLYTVRRSVGRWGRRTETGIEIIDADTGKGTKYLWR